MYTVDGLVGSNEGNVSNSYSTGDAQGAGIAGVLTWHYGRSRYVRKIRRILVYLLAMLI